MSVPITIPLDGSHWTLRPAGDTTGVAGKVLDAGAIGACVPGCVHTDLIRAGLLIDPNLDRHEKDQFWIGETDWEYSCEFEVTPEVLEHDRVDLVFEGLDTIATVCVNESRAGTSMNMHTCARFEVRRVIREGTNTLTVRIDSPNKHAREMEQKLGSLPHVYPEQHPWNFIRKMACNFGWDWGPVCTTSGIWRPAALHAWSGARIASIRPEIEHADEELAVVRVHAELEHASSEGCVLELQLEDPRGSVVAGSTAGATDGAVSETLEVKHPRLWWPRSHGGQPLYTLRLTLKDARGSTLDGATRTIGLRTVVLDNSLDEIGSRFDVVINGERVFCTGANWIPDDLFPSRVTPDRYRTRVQSAADCGMNMLRVWGGGIYEDEAFYNACDELGVLVWQDFLFACALYPEAEPMWSLVEDEARDNIARLSHHPSLVLWCGSNENIWGYQSWGWKKKVEQLAREGEAERPWGNGFYNDLLPRLCAQLDPSRPYWASSPWSGTMDQDCADPNHGNRHTWEGWGPDYRKLIPRFLSEFGHQAPANYASLARVTPAEELCVGSESMVHRQRAVDGNEGRIDTPLSQWFETPTDFDDWHYLSQVLQARSVTTAIEWLRAHRDRCSGVLFWQFNDTWVGHTWACVDHDGRRKPLWYATRRSNAPRLLTIQPESADEGSPLWLYAVNETDEAWEETVAIGSALMTDREICSHEIGIEVPARGAQRVVELESLFPPGAFPRGPDRYFWARAASSPHRTPATWFDAVDKELEYPEPELECRIEDGTIVIRAHTLVRDLLLQPDRLDPGAVVDENLITMLPGDECRIEVHTGASLDLSQLSTRPVMMSANLFGKC